MEILNSILNNALLVTLLIILVSALIGFYVKVRVRDRCLRDLDGFRVTVEAKNGKVAWGTLRVYGSGIELRHDATHLDGEGHVETSYILYANEVANLQAIYRFHDHQSDELRREREREIRRTYQPSIYRRAARSLRNLFSAFKDAIVQMTNAVLGFRAAQSPGTLVLSQHKELTASGTQLLGAVAGNAYEPILEHHIGQYVVVEILHGEVVEEEYGILKEYSAHYVELLDVKLRVPLHVYLQDRLPSQRSPVHVEPAESCIRVSHDLERTLLVDTVRCGESVRKVDVPIDPAQSVEIELSVEETGQPVELDLSVRCLADLIVPRTLAVVRHAGRREKPSLDTLLGLDTLPGLPWVKRLFGAEPERRIDRQAPPGQAPGPPSGRA